MVSPVSLSAVGVVVAGTAAIMLGLAYEPAPLPADVVTPVRFAPAHPASPTMSGPAHRARGSTVGPTAIPNRPVVFPDKHPGGGRDSSRTDDRTPAAGVQPSTWSADTSRSSHRATDDNAGSTGTQLSGSRVYGPVGPRESELGR
jgi:hypothetical protein